MKKKARTQSLLKKFQGIEIMPIVFLLLFVPLDLYAFYGYMRTPGSNPVVDVSVAAVVIIALNLASLFFGRTWKHMLDPVIQDDDKLFNKAKFLRKFCAVGVVLLLLMVTGYRIVFLKKWFGRGMGELIMTFIPYFAAVADFFAGLFFGKSELEKMEEKYTRSRKEYIRLHGDFSHSFQEASHSFGPNWNITIPTEIEMEQQPLARLIKNKPSSDWEKGISDKLEARDTIVEDFLRSLKNNIQVKERSIPRLYAMRILDDLQDLCNRLCVIFGKQLTWVYTEMKKENSHLKNPLEPDVEPTRYNDFKDSSKKGLEMNKPQENGKTEKEEMLETINVKWSNAGDTSDSTISLTKT